MTTTREAKHLSGADLAKTITVNLDENTVTRQLTSDERLCTTQPEYSLGRASTILEIILPTGLLQTTLEPTHPVTITGTPTPPGLDLHKSVLDQDG